MRILIKENHRTKLSLWLPSGNLVIATFLRHFQIDGKRLSAQQRKKLLTQIKQLRKLHKPLIWIDIEQKNGDKVFIKI